MDYRFYMARMDEAQNGYLTVGEYKDLEADFPGLRYKELKGLNSYGAPRVYSETFVEDDGASVYVPSEGLTEQTELTLTLYFFGRDDDATDAEAYAHASQSYHSFMDFIRGHKLSYYDTARNRKVVMYLSSAVSPKEDRLIGHPYLEAEFKFKSLTGHSEAVTQGDDE